MSIPKPHAICIPLPFQSHMKAMLKLAKLLYTKCFHITFVNTEFNHNRLLRSRGPHSLDGLPGFRFETIPDGLPPLARPDDSQDVSSLCDATMVNLLAPFRDLVAKLKDVTCIVSDGYMPFPITVGEEIGVPVALFFTTAACSFMAFMAYGTLKEKGLLPLKDESYLTNGLLDTMIDWIPGLKPIRLRDLPSFMQTTDPNEPMLTFCLQSPQKSPKASAILFHTFDALELNALTALKPTFPQVLGIAPIQLLLNRRITSLPHDEQEALKSLDCNLWREEAECLQWLDSNKRSSVVYVNFGSLAVVSPQDLVEFAWGIANSKHPFLWVIRPDLMAAILPPEFVEETKERRFVTSWCPQEEVLDHPSVGGFLTHCGWNSTMESLSSGVPMICWTFFGDQTTNSRYICNEWGFGAEMDRRVERSKVERVVREVMEGHNKGKEMKEKAMDWKRMAEEAVAQNGSSSMALDKLVSGVLLSRLERLKSLSL